MPAISPEAISRKANNLKKKRRAKTEEARIKLQKSDWPRYKIAARKMRGKLPEMTKSELREMLAQAARNTAAQS